MNQKQIDEILELVECFGGMKQNSGITRENEEDADFYESVAAGHFAEIRTKLHEFAGWQPIETAPKDQWVRVVYSDREVSKAIFNAGIWLDWGGDLYGTPTHWQPLPEPPCEQPS